MSRAAAIRAAISPTVGTSISNVIAVSFTPGGTVVLDYDVGGYNLQQFVIANSNGSFRSTEPGIVCGPLPESPPYGVIVTAYDQSSGKSTRQGFPTPC